MTIEVQKAILIYNVMVLMLLIKRHEIQNRNKSVALETALQKISHFFN